VLWTLLRVVLALAAAVTIYVLGAALLRVFKVPAEEPGPDPALLRPVDVRFRCEHCGAEVTMTVAAGDDPDPPRHCRDDMAMVADPT